MNWFKRYDMRKEAGVKVIPFSEALSRKMFGPLYHGTDEEGRSAIEEKGFEVIDLDDPRKKHGYEASGSYLSQTGTPPPIHHLGEGIYLTTKKSVAKDFAAGTTSGMKAYYIDAPNMLTINFGAENTMMKWWKQNGYDYDQLRASGMEAARARVEATRHLTANLAKYGAVWFKGKSLYRLLDGDQVCVYDPSLIYEVEPWKVRRKSDGMVGSVVSSRDASEIRRLWSNEGKEHPWLNPDTKKILTVKWKKGGTAFNVQDVDVDPA